MDPLIGVRAVHFAATLSVSGVVFFLAWVGEPAFRVAAADEAIAAVIRRASSCVSKCATDLSHRFGNDTTVCDRVTLLPQLYAVVA